jgi:uncharacterized protein YggU (UPF0235/DUF167 family)
MQIFVKVIQKAKFNQIELLTPNHYKIKTTAPAVNNQANLAVIEILARYLNLKKNQIILQKGSKSSHKVFSLPD